jgi:hypothetical protein
MSVTSSKIWLKVIGSPLLVLSTIILVSSIAVFAFLFIVSYDLDFCKSVPKLGFQLVVVFSLSSDVASCVYIALSTESYVTGLPNFSIANPADELVIQFISDHPTPFSLRAFVYQRTTDQPVTIVVFFAIWAGGDSALVPCTACLAPEGSSPNALPRLKPRRESLVPRRSSTFKVPGLAQDGDAVDEGGDEAGDPERPRGAQQSSSESVDRLLANLGPRAERPFQSFDALDQSSGQLGGRKRRQHGRAHVEYDGQPDLGDTLSADT